MGIRYSRGLSAIGCAVGCAVGCAGGAGVVEMTEGVCHTGVFFWFVGICAVEGRMKLGLI